MLIRGMTASEITRLADEIQKACKDAVRNGFDILVHEASAWEGKLRTALAGKSDDEMRADAVSGSDIDKMRDVYMTQSQRAAYERILLAARSAQGMGS